MSRRSEFTEAKASFIRAFDAWAAKNIPADRKATALEALSFYENLVRENSYLLQFKTKVSNRWKLVLPWLLQAGKVTE